MGGQTGAKALRQACPVAQRWRRYLWGRGKSRNGWEQTVCQGGSHLPETAGPLLCRQNVTQAQSTRGLGTTE